MSATALKTGERGREGVRVPAGRPDYSVMTINIIIDEPEAYTLRGYMDDY